MLRRKMLKSVVAASVGTVIGSSATSAESDSPIPAKDAGVYEEVKEKLQIGELEDAKSLLDDYNVEHYYHRTYEMKKRSDDEIQPQTVIEDDCWVECNLVHSDGDEWLVTGNWHLEGDYVVGEYPTAAPEDVMALYWDNSQWSSPNMTEDNVWLNGGPEGGSQDTTEYDEYNKNSVAALNYPEQHHPDHNNIGSLQTDLLKDSDNQNVGVGYDYEYTSSHDVSNVSFSVGPLGISLESDVNGFKMEGWADL